LITLTRTLILIFFFPVFVDSAIAPISYYGKHYCGTKAIWDARMGHYTQDELNNFVKGTWIGTDGNIKCAKALASISILENGPKRYQREKTGYLGGHKETIKKGAKEAKVNPINPYLKTLSLSRHFLVLYYHYDQNLEKTCRIWNKGPKWKGKLAERYWKGVIVFSRIYDSGVVK